MGRVPPHRVCVMKMEGTPATGSTPVWRSLLAVSPGFKPGVDPKRRRHAAVAPPFCRLCAAVGLSRMHQCTLGAD